MLDWEPRWDSPTTTTHSTPSPNLGLTILKMAFCDPVDLYLSNLKVSANHLRLLF